MVERVAIDRVVPTPAPESDAPVHYPEAPSATDMQEKKIDGETWLVESLDDHRKTGRGKLEFLVRWTGPYERTWEPRANVPEELISRYFATLRKKVDAKRKKASKLVTESPRTLPFSRTSQVDPSTMSECSDRPLVDADPPPLRIESDIGGEKPSPPFLHTHRSRPLPSPGTKEEPFVIRIPLPLPLPPRRTFG